VVLPSEMHDVLHAPYPDEYRTNRGWDSLEMLRDLYRKNPDHPKTHEARLALETAMVKWSDDQIADFMLNYLFEPPYSLEFQSKSPSELRQMLATIYRYLFDLQNSDAQPQ
jgi:hypothetical protein